MTWVVGVVVLKHSACPVIQLTNQLGDRHSVRRLLSTATILLHRKPLPQLIETHTLRSLPKCG